MTSTNPRQITTWIISDSWAWCWYSFEHSLLTGEQFFSSKRYRYFANKKPTCNYPILQDLLAAQGHTVTVLGNPGASNLEQINALEKHLSYKLDPPDVVIFLQTDPLRDLIEESDFYGESDNTINGSPDQRMAERLGVKHWDIDEFEHHVERLTKKAYNEIFDFFQHNKLTQTHLLLLGGCGIVNRDIFHECLKNYKINAHIVSESILADVHHILSGESKPQFHTCYMNRIEHLVDDSWNASLVDHIYNISWHTACDLNPDLILHTYPDRAHLNATSMVVVAEIINQYLDSLGL